MYIYIVSVYIYIYICECVCIYIFAGFHLENCPKGGQLEESGF